VTSEPKRALLRATVFVLGPLIVVAAAAYLGRQVDTRTIYATEFGDQWPFQGYRSAIVRCFPRTLWGKKVPMVTIRLGKGTYGLNAVARDVFGLPGSHVLKTPSTSASGHGLEGAERIRKEGISLCGNLDN
jgi:hypothetical protein